MEEEFSEELEKSLLVGENILWMGKPESKVIFYHVFVGISFSILCGCAEIFSIILGINFFINHGYIPFNYLVGIVMLIVFIFFTLYITILGDKFIWKNTLYVVTNKRVLVIIIGMYEQAIAKNISEINYIGISKESKKSSEKRIIVFGEIPFPSQYSRYYKDLEGIRYSHIGSIPIFNDVHDAMKVYELVNNLRDKVDNEYQDYKKV